MEYQEMFKIWHLQEIHQNTFYSLFYCIRRLLNSFDVYYGHLSTARPYCVNQTTLNFFELKDERKRKKLTPFSGHGNAPPLSWMVIAK